MRYRECEFENPEGMNFCGKCATSLVLPHCRQCGFDNPAGFAFCGKCGSPLTASVQSSKPVLPAPVPQAQVSLVEGFQVPSHNAELRTVNSELSPVSYTPPHLAERIRAATITDGERKTISALFADLKGSTALIEGLDPEEARAILDPALQLMMDAVHRYEGYVAQVLGDGIFALFGAPIAHEDHPQRALFAALRMQEEMRRYSDEIRLKHGVPLAMRVGINTGEVVVRSIRKDDLHTDYVPVGHATNLAARMEQMATPGSILVSAYTHKLTDGYFAFKALGQTQIKEVEKPLAVYEVLSAGPLRTRLQVTATRRGLTRFVGRQREMEHLQQALAQAKAAHGQIVGVMGEPGLGKSRLFYEFKLPSQTGCLILEAYSVSHGKASPYLPVIELLKSYFDINAEDDERKRREKVGGKVLMLDRSLEDTLPYLFALLGIEEQPSPLQQMDPQIRRRRTFEALKKLFLRESLNQPLVLIFEDLHWIDSETQGLLDTLSEGIASAKILLLVNYRPEYRHEWGSKTYYTQLRLAPFGQAEAEESLTFLLGHDPRLTALKQQILAKTEGTPFFMEEVVQTLVEDGTLTGDRGNYRLAQAVVTLQLPPTVQGVLAARIDRLAADEKALMQQLAVIGREFPLSLVKHVIVQPEEDLYRLLSSLQHKEFLYEQPAFPDVEYMFKHALTQEVAYGTVLHEQRKSLHEQTAQVMERLYHGRLEEHFSDLAYHYSRSENTQKAVEYLHKAGQQAVQRSANAEAITHLSTALELLKSLPVSRERAHQELTLLLTLSSPLLTTLSFTSLKVIEIYTRARELCQQLGETRQLFHVLYGLRTIHQVHGEFLAARELGEQLLALAQREQDPALLVEAQWALGSTFFNLGKFGAAQTHLAQGMTLYDARHHPSQELLYGMATEVLGLVYAAWVLWHLGYPAQALKKSKEACILAQERSHPFGLASAQAFAAMLHQLHRESVLTRECAEAGITLAHEHGFPVFLGQGAVLHGWGLTQQGQSEEGVTQIHQGLTTSKAIGVGWCQSYNLALLAEAHERAERVQEGLSALSEALAVIGKTSERFYEAEVYRIKGELTLQLESKEQRAGSKTSKELAVSSKEQEAEPAGPRPMTPDPQGEAEACFLKAIEIAQQQHAKSLELRATVSLARLWQQQGKRAEAHQMLSEIYGWFTEGFETKDLQEAKALLQALA